MLELQLRLILKSTIKTETCKGLVPQVIKSIYPTFKVLCSIPPTPKIKKKLKRPKPIQTVPKKSRCTNKIQHFQIVKNPASECHMVTAQTQRASRRSIGFFPYKDDQKCFHGETSIGAVPFIP